MFGDRWFGARYFGDHFFGPGAVAAAAAAISSLRVRRVPFRAIAHNHGPLPDQYVSVVAALVLVGEPAAAARLLVEA